MNRRALLGALTAGALARWASPAFAAPRPLLVLAAASLTEALSQAGAAFTATGQPPLTFSFDASSRLARQIESGAPADAFFSADQTWMDHLATRGLLAEETRQDLVGNRLVAVVGASSPLALARPADLASPGLRRLALAGESVPAGRYARAAFERLGLTEALGEKIVNGDHVRSVLRWVAAGEVDAGVVYATDAVVEPKVRVAFVFPPESHPPIVYPMAALRGAPPAAGEFLRFCRGTVGLPIFLRAGFTALG